MTTQLPRWLVSLRSSVVVEPVRNDPRTVEHTVFGIDLKTAQRKVLANGQANFDKSWNGLSPHDRALVYAYLNQLGHLEELVEAFRQLFKDQEPPNETILIDIGCGPCTGGLAFTSVYSNTARFDYIGVDRSQTMRELGELMAATATQMNEVNRQWIADITSAKWNSAPGWRPIIVVVSYLLASPTLIPGQLVTQLETLLRKIGNGPVTVLYTNSNQPIANLKFPEFNDSLNKIGFKLYADDEGEIVVSRRDGSTKRNFRYALFHRPLKRILKLDN
ncbi:MAG: hypothetical protein OXH02_04145 [Gemmatimonadetes bacterium]|nr:hypothetical protein [Gemmatimonadota bacterium]